MDTGGLGHLGMRVRSRVGKAYMYKTKQDDVTTQHPQMVVSDVIITEYQ